VYSEVPQGKTVAIDQRGANTALVQDPIKNRRKALMGCGVLLCATGAYVLIFLAVTERSAEWIFPTGIAGGLMIAAGLQILNRVRVTSRNKKSVEASAEKRDVSWGPCCFCGRDIAKTDSDPCRVTVETAKEKWQVWFCHAECFRSRITRESSVDLSPAHF
jgi:hypothetical protein